ncbi:MAG: asparagine synthetase B family protein, partial [Betaproteobacteria bacterium]
DQRRGRVLLGRDRLGKKPLYYTTTRDGVLAFASELKCLFAVPGFEPRVASQSVREYFALGYVPSPATIYEGVHKLPPAHVLTLERGRVSLHRYWSLAYNPKWTGPDESLADRLHEQLDDAVRVRLVSDVPFGAFLSGGLDSSVVAALMARHLGAPLQAFTIGFREAAYDELPDARRVARHIGAQHHELVVEADAVKLLQKLVWHCDEPFGDSSAVPTFLVAGLAASRVKMVLSGDGGDEAFAGYERYAKYLKLQSLARRSFGAAPALLDLASVVAPGHLGRRLGRIGERMRMPWPDDYLAGVAVSTPEAAARLLMPDTAAIDPFARIRARFEGIGVDDPAERMLAGDLDS